ncbi:hypothetical protein LZ24_00650 [Desulfobotulus alkaliphilus]|uniref:Rubredoxin-like domain-containing protein n=1 Tax=Desulfobotulus alkaliphilus TaxID=622671 RepID=A0A562S2M4_9BACT|nr:DUF2231 domain-containing protein [Desulfobotulus alkaliphilus]TWI75602.1 hypothetical protein LZ24_00650 [Desulfobotulus alkaliphilus]
MQEWTCTVCGYKQKDPYPPESCPACGAGSSLFEAAEAGEMSSGEKETGAARASSRWRCVVCGYIHEGEGPPETCPVCGADRSAFEPVEEPGDKAAEDTADPNDPPPFSGEKKKKFTPQSHPREWADEQILVHHAHPISVHIPNGVLPIAVFFVLVGSLFNAQTFKIAAYLNMTMVFLALPLVLYTGFVEWRDRYRSAMTSLFKTKILCAAITAFCVTVLVIWRSFSADAGGFFFILLHLIALGAAGLAGHLGGKLVFAKRG